MRKIVPVILAASFCLSVCTLAGAASLDNIQFLKISPQDAKAVIKNADGKLLVIKPGDVVEEGVTVREIATGRIVLEEKTDKGSETIIVRMSNDKANIERIRKQPVNRPVLVAPAKSDI